MGIPAYCIVFLFLEVAKCKQTPKETAKAIAKASSIGHHHW